MKLRVSSAGAAGELEASFRHLAIGFCVILLGFWSLAVPAGAQTVSLTVSPAQAGLPIATFYQPYEADLTASGGVAPYTFSLVSGPEWLSLSADGHLSSDRPTPLGSHDFGFRFEVTDEVGASAVFDYNLLVSHEIRLTPDRYLPNAVAGEAYETRLVAREGTPPYTFELTDGPAWLSLAADGTITGTPAAAEYWKPVKFAVSDAGGRNDAFSLPVSVRDSAPEITVSPADGATLPTAYVGEGYSLKIEPGGGIAPYQFAHRSGLPLPLSLNSVTGTITGTPIHPGVYTVSILVTDYEEFGRTITYTLPVKNNPHVSMDPPPGPLPPGNVGAAYAEIIRLSNDTDGGFNYIYVMDGSVPGLDYWGSPPRLHGVPTEAGTHEFTIEAREAETSRVVGKYAYSVTINEADYKIELAPASGTLDAGMVGVPYVQDIAATGGQPPYSYKVVGGSLLGGLSLKADSGEISGEPYWPGTRDFVVEVTDANGYTARGIYALPVQPRPDTNPIVIYPEEHQLERPIVGEFYSVTFSTEGGVDDKAQLSLSGSLPPGLTFDPETGTLSGTPTHSANAAIILYARDSIYNTGWRSYAIAPRETIAIMHPPSGALPDGWAGEAYSVLLSATGGAPPIDFSVTGGLPDGISLRTDPEGFTSIAGTPIEYGEFSFSLTATDGVDEATSAYTLSIAPKVLTIAPATLPQGRVGVAYSQRLAVDNATGDVFFELESSTLPAGLDFDAETGTISGTPTTAGSGSLHVIVTDEGAGVGHASLSLAVLAREVIGFNPPAGALSSGLTGYPYSETIAPLAPGAEDVTLSLPGKLPEGLSFDAATGVLSGRPVETGTFTFTVDALDPDYGEGSAVYSIAVTDPEMVMTPAPGPLPKAAENVPISPVSFSVAGAPAGTYELAIEGAVPPGLDWNAATATLSGVPASKGTYALEIAVTRSADRVVIDTFAYSLNVGERPTLDVEVYMTPPAYVGQPIVANFSASGGIAPYTFTTTSLPPGISKGGNTFVSGTPTTPGTFTFTVMATDVHGNLGESLVTLEVKPEPLPFRVLTPVGPLPDAMVNEEYGFTLDVEGGVPPYSFMAVSLPDGLTIEPDSGLISGKPVSVAENTTVSIFVTDSLFNFAFNDFTMTVVEQELSAPDKSVSVPPGADVPPVDLTQGATGGPFQSAAIVSVTPANAGTAWTEEVASNTSLAMRMTTFASPPHRYILHFEPNPDFYGVAKIQFQLTSALGRSNVGTVTYTMTLDEAAVRQRFEAAAPPAVARRQQLLDTMLNLPTLLSRRAEIAANRPVDADLSGGAGDIRLGFNASLLQMAAAAQNTDPLQGAATVPSPPPLPFNVWIDGALALAESSNREADWDRFGLVSVGADYLINDRLLVGLSIHRDWMSQTTVDSMIEGRGLLYGPYISAEIIDGVYLDGHLLYGQSWNDIESGGFSGVFETERLMLGLDLSGVWRDGPLALVPKLSLSHNRETADGYTVDDGIATVALDGFANSLSRVGAGATLSYQFDLDEGLQLTPEIGFTLGTQYSGSEPAADAYGSLNIGLSLQNEAWNLKGGISRTGAGAINAQVGLSGRF